MRLEYPKGVLTDFQPWPLLLPVDYIGNVHRKWLSPLLVRYLIFYTLARSNNYFNLLLAYSVQVDKVLHVCRYCRMTKEMFSVQLLSFEMCHCLNGFSLVFKKNTRFLLDFQFSVSLLNENTNDLSWSADRPFIKQPLAAQHHN